MGIAKIPASNQTVDINAGRAATFAISGKNCWSNTWFADLMIWGKYPEEGLKLFAKEMPEIRGGDVETICQPPDFYGVNIYFDGTVRARSSGDYEVVKNKSAAALTTMPWEATPESWNSAPSRSCLERSAPVMQSFVMTS